MQHKPTTAFRKGKLNVRYWQQHLTQGFSLEKKKIKKEKEEEEGKEQLNTWDL